MLHRKINWLTTLFLLASPLAAQAQLQSEALIEKYDLEVADQPVSTREDWREPERILVTRADAERLQWLQQAVPDVELIAANSDAEVAENLANVDAVMGLCSSTVLEQAQALRWIQLYTAGVENCLRLPAFSDRKPLLTNMQRIAAPVIAEHVIAMMLSLSRNLPSFQQAANSGNWQRDEASTQGMQVVNGKTMLVVGLGGIGTEAARRAHALGMTVTATRASSRKGPDFVSEVGLPPDLPRLITDADVVVNALPLTDSTRDLFDKKLFAKMKKSALFINVGRGGSVVTEDLVAALENGQIAGAGLDVTDPEPLPAEHPLWQAPNTIITPHVASRSDLDREGRWQLVRDNLRRYVAGEPMLSVVDPEQGY